MDIVHLVVQVLVITVGPIIFLVYWIADQTGAGWSGLLAMDLVLAAATAVDKNPWACLLFVLLFFRHFMSAFQDWDRAHYEPSWLRNTPNHDRVLWQLGTPGLPIADSPYKGARHSPGAIHATGEIPVYADKFIIKD